MIGRLGPTTISVTCWDLSHLELTCTSKGSRDPPLTSNQKRLLPAPLGPFMSPPSISTQSRNIGFNLSAIE